MIRTRQCSTDPVEEDDVASRPRLYIPNILKQGKIIISPPRKYDDNFENNKWAQLNFFRVQRRPPRFQIALQKTYNRKTPPGRNRY
jgi:hypothetical protein